MTQKNPRKLTIEGLEDRFCPTSGLSGLQIVPLEVDTTQVAQSSVGGISGNGLALSGGIELDGSAEIPQQDQDSDYEQDTSEPNPPSASRQSDTAENQGATVVQIIVTPTAIIRITMVSIEVPDESTSGDNTQGEKTPGENTQGDTPSVGGVLGVEITRDVLVLDDTDSEEFSSEVLVRFGEVQAALLAGVPEPEQTVIQERIPLQRVELASLEQNPSFFRGRSGLFANTFNPGSGVSALATAEVEGRTPSPEVRYEEIPEVSPGYNPQTPERPENPIAEILPPPPDLLKGLVPYVCDIIPQIVREGSTVVEAGLTQIADTFPLDQACLEEGSHRRIFAAIGSSTIVAGLGCGYFYLEWQARRHHLKTPEGIAWSKSVPFLWEKS